MTPHINAKQGDIAKTVLLPGDPRRARWVAQTFLTDARLVNEVRGMEGWTGTWNGHPVTVHGTGMGMPSLSIYVNELIKEYGAKTLIRIGSCGGMQPHVKLRDVVLAMATTHASAMNRSQFGHANFAPCADWSLLLGAAVAASKAGVSTHIGNIYSSDVFYSEDAALDEQLTRHGILAVEMEAAELYTLAARHACRALAVLTVSDHLVSHESLPPEDRERSFGDMVQIALEAAFA
ncbi:MAG: purine-nucleoside phosphorylase [Paracoccaceae bacterium]